MIKKIISIFSVIGIVFFSTYYNREKIIAVCEKIMAVFHDEEPILIDEINFDEEIIQIFYDADEEFAYYYQDEKGNKYYGFQTKKNTERTKALYIDYSSSREMKQGEVLLEPELIIEGIDSDISVFILDTHENIKIKNINSSDDYIILLCNTQKKGWCSEKISLDLLVLQEMVGTWKLCENPVDNIIKDGITCLTISENWETYDAKWGYITSKMWDFSFLRLEEGAYIQISGSEVETYFLQEEQFKAFCELLGL